MLTVAVIEDDPPMSAQLRGWIEAARRTSGRAVVHPRRRRSGDRPAALRRRGDGHRTGSRASRWRCPDQRHQQTKCHASARRFGNASHHLSQHHEGARRPGLPCRRRPLRNPISSIPFWKSCGHRVHSASRGKGTRSERRRTVSGPAASGLATLARATHQPATDRTAHSRRAA